MRVFLRRLGCKQPGRRQKACGALREDHPMITRMQSLAQRSLPVVFFTCAAARQKQDIYNYASSFYDLDFSLDEIRSITFDVSCKGSVPQAIRAFLEGSSFTDVLSVRSQSEATSDTIAAIAGSIAEVIYPAPQKPRDRPDGQISSEYHRGVGRLLISPFPCISGRGASGSAEGRSVIRLPWASGIRP